MFKALSICDKIVSKIYNFVTPVIVLINVFLNIFKPHLMTTDISVDNVFILCSQNKMTVLTLVS